MNNVRWRDDAAQAHDAKAAAIEVAVVALEGLDGALEALTASKVRDTMTALDAERVRHERASLLHRGRTDAA